MGVKPMYDRARGRNGSDLISLADVLKAVSRRLPLVLTAGVGGLILGLLLVAWIDPAYKASTTLIVVSVEGVPLDYNAVQLNRNLARTYVEVARSRAVAIAALEALNSAEPPQKLQDRVRVTTIGETELIQITVTDSNPGQAATIANTLAGSFREQVRLSMGVDNVRVVDEAAPPGAPITPRPVLIFAVLGLSGLCAGVGVALLMDRLGLPR